MRFLPALALGFSLFAATAHAEDAAACPAKATILSLSDIVLADRDKLPRLKARGYGAEAAYLKILYGALPIERAADLAHGLRDAGVREALDLAGAIDATRGGLDALDITDPAQLNGQISTLRAILLHGDGEKLLAAIAALPPERQTPLVERIVPAIVDWPDEDKAKLAAAAGKHKMYFLQAGLVASQRDAKAWPVFVAGLPAQDKLEDLTRVWSWAPALAGNPALPRLPLPDAQMQAQRDSIHALWIVAVQEPDRDFLMTYLNQTGDIPTVEKAGQAVMTGIKAGEIKPEGPLDPAWLVAYRALRAATLDASMVDTMLETISLNTRRVTGPSSNVSVRDVLDRIVAVDALMPYLTGKANELPAMPADISVKFQADWPVWTELAASLKSAPLTPLAKDAAKAPIVAELLFAAGDHARLADFVLTVEPAETKLAIATDFAMRLDRTCASYMYHPAEALMLSGQPIFRFNSAK